MKHFLLFLTLFFLSIAEVPAQKLIYGSGDTLTNAGTVNLKLDLTQSCEHIVFEVVNEKISGAVAGKTYFEVSLNGENFIILDSLLNVNKTTNIKKFEVPGCNYRFYNLRSVGTGTMKYKTYGRYYLRK